MAPHFLNNLDALLWSNGYQANLPTLEGLLLTRYPAFAAFDRLRLVNTIGYLAKLVAQGTVLTGCSLLWPCARQVSKSFGPFLIFNVLQANIIDIATLDFDPHWMLHIHGLVPDDENVVLLFSCCTYSVFCLSGLIQILEVWLI